MKRLVFFPAVVFCIGILLSLSGTPTQAQTASSGSITGQVSDPQGASVPGADVTLTDIGTKSKQSATTNDSGRYTFPVVNSGLYDIVVSKSGFKVAKMAQQKVSIGLVLTVNVTLEVGSLAETVVVTSSPLGSELQTANATIGNTIDLKQLELLPNLGRDATSLLSLQPGVTPRGDIAGSYMDQNTFTVDGGNNRMIWPATPSDTSRTSRVWPALNECNELWGGGNPNRNRRGIQSQHIRSNCRF